MGNENAQMFRANTLRDQRETTGGDQQLDGIVAQ